MSDLDSLSLEQIVARLKDYRVSNHVFVIMLERTPQGGTRLLDYGLRTLSELTVYIAAQTYIEEKSQ